MKLLPEPNDVRFISGRATSDGAVLSYLPGRLSTNVTDCAAMTANDGLKIIEAATSNTEKHFVGIIYPVTSSRYTTQNSSTGRWSTTAGKELKLAGPGEVVRARVDGVVTVADHGCRLCCGADGLVKIPTDAGTYTCVAILLRPVVADGDYPEVLVCSPFDVVVSA